MSAALILIAGALIVGALLAIHHATNNIGRGTRPAVERRRNPFREIDPRADVREQAAFSADCVRDYTGN